MLPPWTLTTSNEYQLPLEFMKTPAALATVFFAVWPCLRAESQRDFPDLSKAFPTEKYLGNQREDFVRDETKICSFATNLAFTELKKIFQKFIGSEWVGFESDDLELKEAINGEIKQGRTAGHSLFSNPRFPKIQIGLTQIKVKNWDEGDFWVNIRVEPKKNATPVSHESTRH